jgi:hypothetical protein
MLAMSSQPGAGTMATIIEPRSHAPIRHVVVVEAMNLVDQIPCDIFVAGT